MPYIEEVYESVEEDMIFFMLTNILEQSTLLICVGDDAVNFAAKAFSLEGTQAVKEKAIYLKDVVSRKKQLMPVLALAAQQ